MRKGEKGGRGMYGEWRLSQILGELEKSGLSLMVYRGDRIIFSSDGKGIMPLLDAVDKIGRQGLRGTLVADKIVGRAAALLILYIHASEAHASVISAGAKEGFEKHGMKFFFSRETS